MSAPPRPAIGAGWPGVALAARRPRRDASLPRRAVASLSGVPVRLPYSLSVRRKGRGFLPCKDLPGDGFQPIEAFAQARADGLGVEIERAADLVIAQIAEIPHFDDSAARFDKLVEGLVDQRDLLDVHQGDVGRGNGAGRVDGQAALGVFGLKRNRGLAAAALGSLPPLAVIPGFVGGDAEEPGLKLAPAVEGIEVPDDGQEDFLANLLN